MSVRLMLAQVIHVHTPTSLAAVTPILNALMFWCAPMTPVWTTFVLTQRFLIAARLR
jgi:hypothetical protein